MARDLPAKADLLSTDAGLAGQNPEELMALKEQLRLLRGFSRWGWLLPLSLLGLIMALAVRSLRGLTRWWGIPVLLGGALSFLVALAASSMAEGFIAQAVGDPGVPDAFLRIVRGVGEDLAERSLGRMVPQSVLLAVAAAVILLLGFLFGKRRAVEAGAPTAPETPEMGPVPAIREPEQGGDRETPTGMFG
jgi:hypothetical protein